MFGLLIMAMFILYTSFDHLLTNALPGLLLGMFFVIISLSHGV